MDLENLVEWTHSLRQDDDLLIGEMQLPFLEQKVPVEVCFVGQDQEVTETQVDTLRGYLKRLAHIHQAAIERIHRDYQSVVHTYRQAFREWGEDPDENAPLIASPKDLGPLLLYQSLFVPSSKEVGTFGMGFWAKWEREHGVGLRFERWRLTEAGENAIHFQF